MDTELGRAAGVMGNTVGSYDTAVEVGRGTTYGGHYLMLSGLPRSSLGSRCRGYNDIARLDVLVQGLFTYIFRFTPRLSRLTKPVSVRPYTKKFFGFE